MSRQFHLPTLRPLLLLLSAFSAVNLSAIAAPPALDPPALAEMDHAIEQAIARRAIPGGVVRLEHGGAVHHKAFGNRTVLPVPAPASPDTIYDAASLTKVVATTPSIMLLFERRRLDLDDPVAKHLPGFSGLGREKITIRHLLTHTSGLRPGIPKEHEWGGRDGALAWIFADSPLTAPGAAFRYSDLNFILLGEVVARLAGQGIDRFARVEIFDPLGMADTGFLPPPGKLPRIAPTERQEDGTILHGVVHDPTARKMGGVAGHAGLFTTAPDLARFARMLLGGGALEGARVLAPETVALMTRLHTPPGIGARRALGWDIESLPSSPRGEIFAGGYGHTGWTGTSIWIDPRSEAFVIFLSNRNHPDENGSVRELREEIGNLAARAVRADPAPPVRNGIDALAAKSFAPLSGLRIGLVTNHTGRDISGRSAIDLLHKAPGVALTALFSPEHGIRGEADASVEDAADPATGLPVHSLYREKTRRPAPEQLRGLDALVFDIQDIGCRFYTYVSTMGHCMEAAAENGLSFFVLDRVNPVGGEVVAGPVLAGERSFTAFHEIPLRHGMTAGELALLFKAERPELAKLQLTVIPCEGWERNRLVDETGLPWVDPSPNMRSLRAALLYPGIGLLEFMNLSVGRGTATPFEVLGAPYIDGEALARELGSLELPGLHFEPAIFIPDASVFKGDECRGVRVALTRRDPGAASIRAALAIAAILNRLHPDEIRYDRFAKLLAHAPTFDAVKAGTPLPETEALWQPALADFQARRAPHLLYR